MRGNQRHALYIPQPSSRQYKSYGENEDFISKSEDLYCGYISCGLWVTCPFE